MDMQSDRVDDLLRAPALPFLRGRHHDQQGVDRVPHQKCDVVLPLVAIATPATYVQRAAARVRARLRGEPADRPRLRAATASASSSRRPPRSTACAATTSSTRSAPSWCYGPIDKPRWIYSCAKQLMDRVIYAYGMQEGLDYTLFRPFNWIGAGPRLDQHGEGRQLARHHAVPRPHRPRRADQAGRRRHAEARLHLHRRRHRRADEDHRQPERHRRPARSTTSATRPTTSRCASWRR